MPTRKKKPRPPQPVSDPTRPTRRPAGSLNAGPLRPQFWSRVVVKGARER